VAAGHLHPATEAPAEEREVEQRGRTRPDIDDVDPGGAKTVTERRRVAIGRQPAIATDGEGRSALLGRQRPEGLSQPVGESFVEVALRYSADVVFAEDRWIQLNTSTECLSRRSLDSQSSKRWPIAFS
jgi:hypothetical protein